MNVERGDKVMYSDGRVVCDEDGFPVIVIDIKYHPTLVRLCVFYENGDFDYLEDVEKCSPLLLELL